MTKPQAWGWCACNMVDSNNEDYKTTDPVLPRLAPKDGSLLFNIGILPHLSNPPNGGIRTFDKLSTV